MYPVKGIRYYHIFNTDFLFNDFFNNCPCYYRGSSPKDKGATKKWLNRLANALKRLAGKVVETLSPIVGSVVGAILSFVGKAVGFVAEHIWALIVFVAGLVG